jgi:hypothetical protein
MMYLVALLQPAQDRDGVGDGRLADEHRLKPAFERGIAKSASRVDSGGREGATAGFGPDLPPGPKMIT